MIKCNTLLGLCDEISLFIQAKFRFMRFGSAGQFIFSLYGHLTHLDRASKIRIKPDRLIKICDRAVVLACFCVGNTAVIERVGIFRVEPDNLVEISDRTIVVALVTITLAALAKGGRLPPL